MNDRSLPQELIDAASRMRDAVNLEVVAAEALGIRVIKWLAIKLEDGRSNGEVYESRKDAVRHTQNLSDGWFYTRVGAETMGEREAIIVLQQARQAFSKGVVFADEAPITPHLTELLTPYIPRTIHNLGIILPKGFKR